MPDADAAHDFAATFAHLADDGAVVAVPVGPDFWSRLMAGEHSHLERGRLVMVVALRGAGSFTVVPRGLWHTARVLQPGAMLFITPGAGT